MTLINLVEAEQIVKSDYLSQPFGSFSCSCLCKELESYPSLLEDAALVVVCYSEKRKKDLLLCDAVQYSVRSVIRSHNIASVYWIS